LAAGSCPENTSLRDGGTAPADVRQTGAKPLDGVTGFAGQAPAMHHGARNAEHVRGISDRQVHGPIERVVTHTGRRTAQTPPTRKNTHETSLDPFAKPLTLKLRQGGQDV